MTLHISGKLSALPAPASGFCRREVNKKCKPSADFVVLVEGFYALKIGHFSHFFLWEVTFEAKYLFGKSLYSCVSIWIC